MEQNPISTTTPALTDTPTEFTEQDIIECLVREVALREKVYPVFIKKGKLTQEKADLEIAKMKQALYNFAHPQPKTSGCNWGSDKNGAFKLHIFISTPDMHKLRIPVSDANLFHQLMEKNKAPAVLNAMALLFAAWEKERQEESRILRETLSKGVA